MQSINKKIKKYTICLIIFAVIFVVLKMAYEVWITPNFTLDSIKVYPDPYSNYLKGYKPVIMYPGGKNVRWENRPLVIVDKDNKILSITLSPGTWTYSDSIYWHWTETGITIPMNSTLNHDWHLFGDDYSCHIRLPPSLWRKIHLKLAMYFKEIEPLQKVLADQTGR